VFGDMAMIGDGQFSPRLFLSSSGENLPQKKQVQSLLRLSNKTKDLVLMYNHGYQGDS
jgi:hypothetical protein